MGIMVHLLKRVYPVHFSIWFGSLASFKGPLQTTLSWNELVVLGVYCTKA